jgi:aryl-alcohol dehydrogenase-like predicted oxidoreductase
VKLPRLGFGVSGAHGTPLVPKALTARLIARMLEAAPALFDTAPFYGQAQARLGRALRGVARERFLVSTKGGTVRAGGALQKDFSAAGLTAQLEGSLRELSVSHIDLFFLHGPAAPLNDEARTALEALKRAGKVRALGICGRGEEIAALSESDGFDAIMAPAFGSWPAYAAEHSLTFLGIEALSGIKRTGAPTRGDVWRLAKRLRGVPAATGEQTAERALAAALTRPGVGTVVVTTTSLAHLDACLAVAAAHA